MRSSVYFRPLGDVFYAFSSPRDRKPRIAPTEREERTGQMLRGVVHDPTARQMGGVAGDEGLFRPRMMWRSRAGPAERRRAGFLTFDCLKNNDYPATAANLTAVRGLGWDIDSPFSSNRW